MLASASDPLKVVAALLSVDAAVSKSEALARTIDVAESLISPSNVVCE